MQFICRHCRALKLKRLQINILFVSRWQWRHWVTTWNSKMVWYYIWSTHAGSITWAECWFLCKIQISEFLKMSDIKETRLDECMVNHYWSQVVKSVHALSILNNEWWQIAVCSMFGYFLNKIRYDFFIGPYGNEGIKMVMYISAWSVHTQFASYEPLMKIHVLSTFICLRHSLFLWI